MKKIIRLLLILSNVLFLDCFATFSFTVKNNHALLGFDSVNGIMSENYHFGSYNIINGWVKVDGFTTNDSYLYCANGDQNSYKPNNILVRKGANSYSLDEIKTFAQAIEFSLRIQTGQTNKPPKAVTGSGGFTKNYIPLITFNLVWDDGTYQNQYYIVRDYGYVMVSEMVNHPENGVLADSVAQEILDSFKFN